MSGRSVWERDNKLAGQGATGPWLAALFRRIDAPTSKAAVLPAYDVTTLGLRLEAGKRQGSPSVIATMAGKVKLSEFRGSPPRVFDEGELQPFTQTLELTNRQGRWVIVRSREASPSVLGMNDAPATTQGGAGGRSSPTSPRASDWPSSRERSTSASAPMSRR